MITYKVKMKEIYKKNILLILKFAHFHSSHLVKKLTLFVIIQGI